MKSEVARFVVLNNLANTVMHVGFSVPRKEADKFYQEDLYMNVAEGIAETSAKDWLTFGTPGGDEQRSDSEQRDSCGSRGSRGMSCRNSRQSSQRLSGSFRRRSISLKPKDMKSIFQSHWKRA